MKLYKTMYMSETFPCSVVHPYTPDKAIVQLVAPFNITILISLKLTIDCSTLISGRVYYTKFNMKNDKAVFNNINFKPI